MCLSVPMRVIEIEGHRARCEALGVERWADLMLMGDSPPAVGAYVTIHLGFVQDVVPEREALEAQALFGEIAAVLDRDRAARGGEG